MLKYSIKPGETLFLLFILVGSAILVGNARGAVQTEVTVNSEKTTTTNVFSLGFQLTEDWSVWRSSSVQRNLAQEAGFKLIRIDSTSIEPCRSWNESTKTGTFYWASVDSLLARIYGIGAEPIVCLGFFGSAGIQIPRGMALNPATGLPYPNSFAAYCSEWVRHVEAAGFAVRFYEVFNEAWWYFYPNWNWNQAKAGYFLQVFNACYDAMHLEDSSVLVGNDASLHRKFLDYWIAHGGKLDLLTYHKYDCDGPSMGDQIALQRAEQSYYVTDSLYYGVNDARQLWRSAHGVTLQAIVTEANWAAVCFPGTDPRIQKVVGAVWTALMLRSSILNNVQYSCYFSFSSSKSWELANKAGGGYGFGMVNQDNNQPWYPYYVQELIGSNLAVGDQIVETTSSSSDIRPLAWRHGGDLNILLTCKVDEQRDVKLNGLEGVLNYSKIDNTVSYQSPLVQKGTINSTALLSLKGYTVILLQKQVSTPTPPPSVNSISQIFQDSFESGDFSAWNGTTTTSGDSATVVSGLSSYTSTAAKFSSSGDGGFEYAYCYADTDVSPDLYACGHFMVKTTGAVDNNDRFYLIRFEAGGSNLAYAGWRNVEGVVRWNLIIRDGTGYASVYSDSTPALNQWYSVQLHWVQDSEHGLGELYVNDDLVCSVRGSNTAGYGSVNSVLFGLAELCDCNSTTVYCHHCSISGEYIGYPPWDLNQDGVVDARDLALAGRAFYSSLGSSNWNPSADINADGIVDMKDLPIVAAHFGEHYA